MIDIKHLREIGFDPFEIVQPISGLYALCLGEKVVYFGKSVNILQRVLEHTKCPPHEFDKIYFLREENLGLQQIKEMMLIGKYEPPGNIAGTKRAGGLQ